MEQELPLVVTYSTFGTRATHTLRTNFKRVLKGTRLGRSFRVIPAYKGNPTLKQLLVRAKLPDMNRRGPLRSRRLVSIRDPITSHGFRIPKHIPLTQSNCVYVIKCTKCRKIYVGETGNGVNIRLAQHKYTIRKNQDRSSHLIAHFLDHGIENFAGYPLEHDPTWTQVKRRKRDK